MHRLFCLLLLLCACGTTQPSSVDVTLSFGASVDAATRASVASFSIAASGDEAFAEVVPLGHAAATEERFVYRPRPETRALTLTVSALDATSTAVAEGMASIALPGSGAHALEIVLERSGTVRDGGVDAAAADLAGPDLASPACSPGNTCITFEGGTGDASGQLTLPDGQSCEIETGVAHSGTHAAHCSGSTPNYYSLDGAYDSTHPLAMRAWLRGSATTVPENANFVGFYDGSDYVLVGTDDAGDYTANYVSGQFNEIDSMVQIGGASWHCLELVLTPTEDVAFYVDSALVGSVNNVIFPTAPSFILGILKAGDGTPTPTDDVYVDDVVIGTSRIGCD